jgi:hypothetical protein
MVRTADPCHGKCGNKFRGESKSAISSHNSSHPDKQWQDIISGRPWPSSGSKSPMGFMRIEELMNLGTSDIEMTSNSPHTHSSSSQAVAALEA